MRIDLHTHSTVSDGTDTPTALVHKAHDAGLDVIALTDHDTFDGISQAVEAGKRLGVTVVRGVEMSCEVDGSSVHLLGYGCDASNRALAAELAKNRAGRAGRLQAFADRFTELGMQLSVADIKEQSGLSPSVGRPHVADALVKKGYVADRREAFETWLADDKPGYIGRYSTPLEDGIDLVHGAGGVAVLAHPWGRNSRDHLTVEYIEQLVRDHELEGIEVDHVDHDEETRSLLFDMGARLGLIRTGSSDYHGTGKQGVPLGLNTTRESAYRELVVRIRRRGGKV
ncbi:PHP domain-containing protein [Tessaracoccus sp. SD287]|uniref:PHP domain-containing protein n=1 Tax=Tessaracoccus sp. SD287 TaxID=2782008 RepID=UPI001A9796EF|nr:PHP domain-containing protein [Tessaracoccus sp. SD287]MBO1030897.1 PHP domain-containing protein [Tessaracoccus sp. SD287]